MGTVAEIVTREVNAYAGEAYNGYVFVTKNVENTRFVATAVGIIRGNRIVNTSLIVQILGDTIIIEQDTNSKPLVDALVQAGIPRSQIILAYAGEPVPEVT